VVDTNGLPIRLALTAGEAHDNRLAGKLLSRLKSGTMLLADRGYDADWIGRRAAAIYTLIATAKLNDIDPQAWIADVLARLPDHPVKRIHELLPWHWRRQNAVAEAA
jgi:IS66 C-terminal element/Transposase DDE domain